MAAPFARLLAALFLTMAAPAALAESHMKSLTDRSDLLGWEAVGRIDFGEAGYCTAVLIAPDILMTAAHCLVDAETGAQNPVEEMTFRAGWRDGEAIAIRRVSAAIVPEAFLDADPEGADSLRYDVGLARLANPIPASTAAPYRVADMPKAGSKVTVVSYGRGRSNAASRQSGCQVLAAGAALGIFDCNGVPGSSGAPVFRTGGHHPEIVSLISSGTRYEGVEVVVGMDLADLTNRLLQDLRAGNGVWPKHLPVARRVTSDVRHAGGARFVRP
jgi:protease YdgD